MEQTSAEVGDARSGTDFKDMQMENAHYWAAQARNFMNSQVHGLVGEWYVEIVAGKPTIVMSAEFPVGGIDALETELVDHNFPDWNRRDLEDETRLFIQPTSDRLVAGVEWRDFESGSYGTS
ncbi:hypothetical protein HLRTI_002905 [Halorhabdus tiamatea SARL4B]|uniref:Uncharacterized protein n=1 Tax=Halorhabdus tiamatea SARL4B TaxID=1033806 RepID=U2DZ92_9EURY|nr:hypothetical protein [Halorhabdus tiamatea]ERJ05106.1 hypothetical protein HLRTI_002905 [Halorhabdus tiamatea SARL4B]